MQVWPYEEPFANNYQRQADEAFAMVESMSADQLRKLRPPLPQIRYLPPRFGYPGYAERQATVLQVFGLTRLPSGAIPGLPQMTGNLRVDYSRNQADRQAAPRNEISDALGTGSW